MNSGVEREESLNYNGLLLEPSDSLAWILGTLSGKGRVGAKSGEVSLGIRDENIQEEFRRLGKTVFGRDIPYRSVWTTQEGKPATFLTPSFFNTRIARALGDLSRTQFPRTITENHNWLLNDSALTLRYAEGLFEARGNIYKRFESDSKDIIFQTSFPAVSDFIAEVLIKLGVTPTVIKMRMGSELRTKGVTISTIPEQKKFAEVVHSLDVGKEKQLEVFRNASLEGVQIKVESQEELVEEWKKMIGILGHPPNGDEINSLRSEGKTKWTAQTYAYWLGATEKSNKFSVARKRLISITNPEIIQEQLDVLAKRHTRRIEVGRKKARRVAVERERSQRLAELDRGLMPSNELAWVLGVLAVGGSVNLKNGSILLSTPDKYLQSHYNKVFGALFRANLTWMTLNQQGGERQIPQYNNTLIARGIGDLRKSVWTETIIEKHSWILEDQKYAWAFLSGVFDNKGYAYGNGNYLVISTSFVKTANFLSELMVNVGIVNPSIMRSNVNREGVQSVSITNLGDMKIFAENVHSVIPEKEKWLEGIRVDTRKPRHVARDETELITEWKKMYEILGHPPNSREILDMHMEGQTRWSPRVYSRMFGKDSYKRARDRLVVLSGVKLQGEVIYRRPYKNVTHVKNDSELVVQYRSLREAVLNDKGRLPISSDFDRARREGLISYSRVTFANYFGDGSFIESAKKLEDLILIEDVNRQLGDYENASRVQIRFIPKVHPVFEPETRDRINNFLSTVKPVLKYDLGG